MESKVFKLRTLPNIFYKVVEEKWVDDVTYCIEFQEMVDCDEEKYHVEVLYHADDKQVTYTRVYEDGMKMDATYYVSPTIKDQIEEYILRQCGLLDKDSTCIRKKVVLELKLEVGLDVSVSELSKWLEQIDVEVKSKSADERIKLIKTDLYS